MGVIAPVKPTGGAIGIATAWFLYIKRPDIPPMLAARFQGVYQFLLNKWYFDELYDKIFIRPAFAIGRGGECPDGGGT